MCCPKYTNQESPVHIYSPDTDVLVLALTSFIQLGNDAAMIMGTGANRRRVPLQPIYDAIGDTRTRALIGFHALSGSDTTGRIFGKSKTAWWNVFLSSSDEVLGVLEELGVGDQPGEQTLTSCEEVLSQLLSPSKCTIKTAAELRWNRFCSLKSNQGVETMPPTQGTTA